MRETHTYPRPDVGSGTVLPSPTPRGTTRPVSISTPSQCSSPGSGRPQSIRSAMRAAADKALIHARHIFSSLPKRDAYPEGSDPETRRFVRYCSMTTREGSLPHWLQPYGPGPRRRSPGCVVVCLLASHHHQAIRCVSGDGPVAQPAAPKVQACSRKALPQVSVRRGSCRHKLHRQSARPPGLATNVHKGDARHLGIDDGTIDLVIRRHRT